MTGYPQTFPPPFGVTHLPTSPPWAGGAAAFVGAYDGITLSGLYSFARRCVSASWGTNDGVLDSIIRVRNTTSQAEMNFRYNASNGLDTAEISTWLGGDSGAIVTCFDQTGNSRDSTNATAAEQPAYVESGINSLPGADFDGTNDYLIGNVDTDFQGEDRPFTLGCVAKTDVIEGSVIISVGWTASNGTRLEIRPQNPWLFELKDQFSLSKTISGGNANTNPHYFTVKSSGTLGDLRVDGDEEVTDGDLDVGEVGNVNRFVIGARTITIIQAQFNGQICEAYNAASELSAAEVSQIETSIAGYYGI